MTNSTNDWQEQLNDIQNALPKRKLTLKNAGDGGMLTNLVLGIIWLAVGLGLFVYSGKVGLEVLQDRKFANNYVVVENARIDGECRGVRKIPFVRGCDVEISTADGRYAKKDFFFISTSKGDYDVEVIAQKDDPSNLTVDLAINHMKARYLTIAILALLGLGTFYIGVNTLLNIPRKNRLKKIMNEPSNQPWQVIATPVEIFAGSSMDFKTDIDGKLVPVSMDIEKSKPITLGETEDDKTVVLAVKASNAPTFVPLTKKLTAFDFTKDEKNALTTAIDKHFS